MHILNPYYITGLVDGQGSFSFYVRNPNDSKQTKRRTNVEARFYIKVVEEDKKILYEVKDFFRCGNVYLQRDSRANHQHCYRYEVTNRKDLEAIIIPFFLRYPLQTATKKKDFHLFSELVRRIAKGEHRSNHGLGVLYSIKQYMR